VSPDHWEILEELADTADVEASIVFVTEDQSCAGDPKKVRLGRKKNPDPETIRGQRDRVMEEIKAEDPDFIMCFGSEAVQCATDNGRTTTTEYQRTKFVFEGTDIPCIATHSLDYALAKHGLRKWLLLDLKAAMAGQVETKWGDYEVLRPGTDDWNRMPSGIINFLLTQSENEMPMLGFDLETYPGLDPWHPDARIRMAVVSVQPGRAWVVQLPKNSCIPHWLDELLRNDQIIKCGSNIKFDYKWMRRFGWDVQNMWDTSTAEHIIDETDPLKGLKSLTFRYLPRLADYSKGHRHLVAERGSWADVLDDEQYDYAGADGEASVAAGLQQRTIIRERGLERPQRLLGDLYNVLAEMESVGVCISREENRRLDDQFSRELDALRERICDHLGPINPNSPSQLADALIENVPDIDLTKTKIKRQFADKYYRLFDDDEESYSTERAILERESDKHEVIEDILTYRRLKKLHGTYVTGLFDKHLVMHPDGKYYVHTSYRTDVVETYRLSSQGPNLQNIPRKPEPDDEHPIDPNLNIKNQYVSRDPDGAFLEADLGQAEIRVAAWLSQDQRMIDAITSGEDLHRAMAAKAYNKKPEDVTKLERTHIKRITFLVMYGGGARTLAAQLGVSKDQAKQLIDNYFQTFPDLRRCIDRYHSRVMRDLMVESPFGFRRRFRAPNDWNTWPGWRIQRQAWNFVVQNTAACITYVAMIDMQRQLREAGLKSQLVLQVHDSMGIDVFPGEQDVVTYLSYQCLTKPSLKDYGVEFDLPLVADVEIGSCWGNIA
jgi:DNA polymerase-1